MTPFPLAFIRRLLAGLLLVAVVGCAPDTANDVASTATTAGGPDAAAGAGTAKPARTFQNDDGSTTSIEGRPQRILSTSVAITGTLLAIDAPVVASASAVNGRFFGQWADVASERGVRNLWPAGSVNLEAAYGAQPDLIVVALTGADSAMPQVEELRRVAPTIVLDYGKLTWQELAIRLGEAIDSEEQVDERIDAFDRHVAQARERIAIPEGLANIISYNGPGANNPIGMREGAHAQLLEALGFRIEAPDPAWHSGGGGDRRDFVWAQFEHLTRLTGPTTFLVRYNDDQVKQFTDEPVLANLPSVRSGQVYGLGANSFRIDYYSGTEIVDGIVRRFGKSPSEPAPQAE